MVTGVPVVSRVMGAGPSATTDSPCWVGEGVVPLGWVTLCCNVIRSAEE